MATSRVWAVGTRQRVSTRLSRGTRARARGSAKEEGLDGAERADGVDGVEDVDSDVALAPTARAARGLSAPGWEEAPGLETPLQTNALCLQRKART